MGKFIMEKLNEIIFYHLDKAIKTYRQFAQSELKRAGIAITIDQWIVLKAISENPGISQRQIAASVFKDQASLTRIIDLLVKKNLLARNSNGIDRRKIALTLNKKSIDLLFKIHSIAVRNRAWALDKIKSADIEITKRVLTSITENCRNKKKRIYSK
jgi:MarR family transcriptional regulator, transcriptional regulator for hemolysin